MAHTPEEREKRFAERERAVKAEEAEAKRLLAEAHSAHREADRERSRARKLAVRFARRLQNTLATARAQIDTDRAAIDEKIAKFNVAQSEFHVVSVADHDRLRDAWIDLETRQKRLAEEWEEVNHFQTEQAAALESRAAELTAREGAETETRAKLQREIGLLREEIAALDARARNARHVIEELEQRRAELQAETLTPHAIEEPSRDFQVTLDRVADRDLAEWTAELDAREQGLKQDRIAVQALFARFSGEKAAMADRQRVVAEQFAQLAAARVEWQEAERNTIMEMEQLARTLRRREAEIDTRDQRLIRADVRRREDAYELWQFRLRLEAWQSKIVAYEMRWHTEREELEADFARREAEFARQRALRSDESSEEPEDVIPFAMAVPECASPALPAELVMLRDELERLAEVLLEAELPERPEAPENELPWGSEDVPMATPEPEIDVLAFEPVARAA